MRLNFSHQFRMNTGKVGLLASKKSLRNDHSSPLVSGSVCDGDRTETIVRPPRSDPLTEIIANLRVLDVTSTSEDSVPGPQCWDGIRKLPPGYRVVPWCRVVRSRHEIQKSLERIPVVRYDSGVLEMDWTRPGQRTSALEVIVLKQDGMMHAYHSPRRIDISVSGSTWCYPPQ